MLFGGRPARKNVRVALQDVVRVLALEAIAQLGVPVEVVEVFQQTEAMHLRHVRIRFTQRDVRRHLDRHLLVSDGGLERGVNATQSALGARTPAPPKR